MNADIDITGVVLNTDRMILRSWRMDDLYDFNEYCSVEGVGEMAGWKHHESLDESREILEMFISGKKTFAIEYNGKAIGSVGIEKYREEEYPEFDDRRCREIGFVLSKDYWGQGLMPEAVQAVITYLFEDVSLDAIFCGHSIWNTQSARVQEKCGFKHYAFNKYKTLMDTVEDNEDSILTIEIWKSAESMSADQRREKIQRGLDDAEAGRVIDLDKIIK